jgi:protein phosphatase
MPVEKPSLNALRKVSGFLGKLSEQRSQIEFGNVNHAINDASLPIDIRRVSLSIVKSAARLVGEGMDMLGVVDVMGRQIDHLQDLLRNITNALGFVPKTADEAAEHISSLKRDAAEVAGLQRSLSKSGQSLLEAQVTLAAIANALEIKPENISHAAQKIESIRQEAQTLREKTERKQREIDELTRLHGSNLSEVRNAYEIQLSTTRSGLEEMVRTANDELERVHEELNKTSTELDGAKAELQKLYQGEEQGGSAEAKFSILSENISGRNFDSMIRDYFAIVTDVGIRKNNEDSAGHAILPDGTQVFIVADGMGGHAAGGLASRVAIEEFFKARFEGRTPKEAVIIANEAIAQIAHNDKSKEGMGTTFVALEVDAAKKEIRIVNVGDSRAKMVDCEKAVLLTRDQALAWLAFETQHPEVLGGHKKYFSDEEIDKYQKFSSTFPNENVIVSALGLVPQLDLITIPIEEDQQNNTVFLLYSDGAMDGEMKESIITNEVYKGRFPANIPVRIKNAAIHNGSKDNVTVAVIILPIKVLVDEMKTQCIYFERDEKGALREKEETANQASQAAQPALAQTDPPVVPPLPAAERKTRQFQIRLGLIKGVIESTFTFFGEELDKSIMNHLIDSLKGSFEKKEFTIHLARGIDRAFLLANEPMIASLANRLKRESIKFNNEIYIYPIKNFPQYQVVGLEADPNPPSTPEKAALF